MSDPNNGNMSPEEYYHLAKKSRDSGVPIATLQKLDNLKYKKPKYTRLSEKKLYKKVKEACQINNLPECLEVPVFKCIAEYLKNGVSQPILLTGNAGIGKTYFAKVLADIIGLGFFKISAPGASFGYGLAGDSPNYKSARYGEISNARLMTDSTNPVILVDEIDKAQHSQSASSHNIEDELLSCLDGTRTIKDNFLNRDIDTKGIVFVLTANEDKKISPWLKDRCCVIHFPDPDFDRVLAISVKMLDKINGTLLYRGRIDADYRDFTDALQTIYADGVRSLRRYDAIIREAATVAYTEFLESEANEISLTFRHLDIAYCNLFVDDPGLHGKDMS